MHSKTFNWEIIRGLHDFHIFRSTMNLFLVIINFRPILKSMNLLIGNMSLQACYYKRFPTDNHFHYNCRSLSI